MSSKTTQFSSRVSSKISHAHIDLKLENSGHSGPSSESSNVTVTRASQGQARSGEGQNIVVYNPNNRADYWMRDQVLYGPYDAVGEVTVTERSYYNSPIPGYSASSIATQGSTSQGPTDPKEHSDNAKKPHSSDYQKAHDYKDQAHKSRGHKSHDSSSNSRGHKKSSSKK
ncbi:hypothetical protein SLS62_006133 [Diatrype stigma]|uniref:Uncharacterized protein n=1 Tax=Diatrype stigma TaxID=117547 RepID=A0AAN9YRH0_9PEZI